MSKTMASYVQGSGFKIIGRFANLSTGIDENGRSTQSPSEDHMKPYTELIFVIYLCIALIIFAATVLTKFVRKKRYILSDPTTKTNTCSLTSEPICDYC